MKENFDRFISCKNTIDNIHARLKKTETDGGEGSHGASAVVVTAAIGDVRAWRAHCSIACFPIPLHFAGWSIVEGVCWNLSYMSVNFQQLMACALGRHHGKFFSSSVIWKNSV